MSRITDVLFVALSLVLCLGLVACTPNHTAQKTDQISRAIGVTSQYHVQRWHNRAIPVSSRLVVSVSAPDSPVSTDVGEVVSSVFAEAFAAAHRLTEPMATASARRQARKLAANFLLDIQAIEVSAATQPPPGASPKGRRPIPSAPDSAKNDAKNTEKPAVTHIKLQIALIDVVSGETIDKLVVSANTAFLNLVGTDAGTLLYEPLARLANDLTGCLNDRCA